MDYNKLYEKIIFNAKSKARSKKDGVYYEKHHIIPKCLGGTNDPENLILLTAREHFIAHWILYRIHPENRAIIAAFKAMFAKGRTNNRYIPPSRAYEESKIAFSESQKGEKNHMFGKPNKKNLGKKHTEESKKRISKALKGIVFSEEHKKKISLSHKGKDQKGRPFSAISPEGEKITFQKATEFAKKYSCNPSCVTRCLRKIKRKLKGFTDFEYL